MTKFPGGLLMEERRTETNKQTNKQINKVSQLVSESINQPMKKWIICAFVFRSCARYAVVSQSEVTKSITRASVRLVRLARRRVLWRAARPHATVILPHTCNVRRYFTLSTVPSQLQRRQFLSNKDGPRKCLTEGSDWSNNVIRNKVIRPGQKWHINITLSACCRRRNPY